MQPLQLQHIMQRRHMHTPIIIIIITIMRTRLQLIMLQRLLLLPLDCIIIMALICLCRWLQMFQPPLTTRSTYRRMHQQVASIQLHHQHMRSIRRHCQEQHNISSTSNINNNNNRWQQQRMQLPSIILARMQALHQLEVPQVSP